MIEFEIDYFCGFIAMIKDLSYWVRGEIRLSHGLLHRGENFLSAVCYQSPKSLFQQMIAHLKGIGYKEIYRNRFVMKCTQEVPITMECSDPPLHEFERNQHLLTPFDIRANESVQFLFLLQLLDEPKDAVKIKYIVNDFIASFKVTLLDTKEMESEFKKDLLKLEVRLEMAEKREAEARRENALLKREKSELKEKEVNLEKESKAMRKDVDENKDVTSAVTFNLRDGATLSINSLHAGDKGATAGHTSDNELRQLEFQYSPVSTDKEIGPEGDNLSVDESSLTIPPKSLVDTQNLSISMLMNFQNLDLPAYRIPVSPYLDVKFRGKLRIPAKARVPTWFRPLEDSEHGIKIYKRYRNEENKVAWRELQNEVTVHDKMIEFEIDHFCGFIAMIKDLSNWVHGEIILSHGLLHRGENFLSAVCYQSPESLFQQMIADLEKKGHKEIYNNRFVMKCTQEIPIKMECFDPPLHKFKPRQHLLTPSDIRANEKFQFPFLLQQLDELKDAVKIEYIVNDFIAPFKVRLLDTKEIRSDGNTTQTICKNCSNQICQVCSNTSSSKAGTTAQSQAVAAGRDINVHGGGALVLLLICFVVLVCLILLFVLLSKFQSYSTGHDEI